MIHGALASAADPAVHAHAQQFDEQHSQEQQQQQSEASLGAEADGEDDDEDDAGEHGADIRSRGSAQSAAPIGRFKSLPSKLGGPARATAGGRALKHTGSMPVNRPVPSSSCMSPGALWPAQQSLNGSLNWSPSRLLLSPQRPMGRSRGAAAVDVGKDVNEEEAAGEDHMGMTSDPLACSLLAAHALEGTACASGIPDWAYHVRQLACMFRCLTSFRAARLAICT
jgi:hypothetical protein